MKQSLSLSSFDMSAVYVMISTAFMCRANFPASHLIFSAVAALVFTEFLAMANFSKQGLS